MKMNRKLLVFLVAAGSSFFSSCVPGDTLCYETKYGSVCLRPEKENPLLIIDEESVK